MECSTRGIKSKLQRSTKRLEPWIAARAAKWQPASSRAVSAHLARLWLTTGVTPCGSWLRWPPQRQGPASRSPS